MKLLCDVCENAVACTVCCADEAALCSACDSQVHAANKLASKHQRVPLIPDTSEPATCDICQERPSFFFCVEDRALLCRDCDLSVHSANALAAKHRRILLVGITVGMSPPQETSSALTVEKHMPATTYTSSSKENNDFALKNSAVQDFVSAVESRSKDNGGMGKKGPVNKLPPSPQKVSNKTLSLALAPINAKSVRVYTRTKEGSLRMASNNDHRKAAPPANTQLNSTTISIQRISEGHRAPFVAPVLSSIRSSLLREEANSKNPNNSSSRHRTNDYYSNSDSVMMDLDASSPVGDGSISDYLNSDASGWRLDELLSDLVGACDSAGRTLSPPKESNIPGFGLHEEHPWFAELDFLEEHELSPSQEESVALVPQMPSPPTHSGLGVSRGPGKPKCPAADQPWAFDYLFTGPDDNTNEFSVVPDVCGRRSLPASPTSPPRGNVKKKRKYWLNAANG